MATKPDAHAKPPTAIREVYKVFQKVDRNALNSHPGLIDLATRCNNCSHATTKIVIDKLPGEIQQSFLDFLDTIDAADGDWFRHSDGWREPQVYEVSEFPVVQIRLLDRLFHHALSNPQHRTNVHMHYHVPYLQQPESSYFGSLAENLVFEPKEPRIHKPISTHQYLNKKLRWVTLGGQYDWTNKVYPRLDPPPFPYDIKRLVEGVFSIKAEAAILNLYSPGDTLSLHRDVSEECDKPLVSVSIGCDGIFVVGFDKTNENGELKVATIRLRSGDVMLMSGPSRYAWHGVPKVVENTCPAWLGDWPAERTEVGGEANRYEVWRGWMKGKRINLNVRQMFDS